MIHVYVRCDSHELKVWFTFLLIAIHAYVTSDSMFYHVHFLFMLRVIHIPIVNRRTAHIAVFTLKLSGTPRYC
jgi:hypothetical protein